jgi:AraC-like DNA-binding protein
MWLLRETAVSMAAIAAKIGIPNQSYFACRFKQAFGMFPRQYRKKPSGK